MNCEGNPVMLSWTTLSMDIFILPSSVISINYFSRLADVFSSSADGNKAAVAQASVKFLPGPSVYSWWQSPELLLLSNW